MTQPRVVGQKNGKFAIVDGSRTLQFLYNAFYWSVGYPLRNSNQISNF